MGCPGCKWLDVSRMQKRLSEAKCAASNTAHKINTASLLCFVLRCIALHQGLAHLLSCRIRSVLGETPYPEGVQRSGDQSAHSGNRYVADCHLMTVSFRNSDEKSFKQTTCAMDGRTSTWERRNTSLPVTRIVLTVNLHGLTNG